MKYTEQFKLNEYLTDKCGPHTYGKQVYDDLFEPVQETLRNYLEIGAAFGGSTLLARDYFTRATVWCVDIIDPNFRLASKHAERIIYVQGNAYKKQIADMFPNEMDIIIDDGSHTLEDQCTAIDLYLNKLSVGGTFIIEDVHNPKVAFNSLDKVMDDYLVRERGRNPWLEYEISTYEGPEYLLNSHSSHSAAAEKEIKLYGELREKSKDDNLYIIKRVK